ncbi:MAG TPA: hypothetical protein VH116_02280 [Gemmatimonadales bacterium]|nr:hypothetical protein [Gemmatimonadales bacterium]
MRARVARPHADTVRFDAPASAHWCVAPGRPGVVLVGSTGGNGALVLLRWRDSLAPGEWPLLQRADTVSPAGAIVGLRFVVATVAHGVPLDSGTAAVTRVGSVLSVRVRGTGLEVTGESRPMVDLTFEAVALARDTVPCTVQL